MEAGGMTFAAHCTALIVSFANFQCKDVAAAVKICGGFEVRIACQLASLLASSSIPPPLYQLNALRLALLLLQFSQHLADPRGNYSLIDRKHFSLTR